MSAATNKTETGASLRGRTGFVYGCQFLYGGWFLFHGLNYWFEFYPDRSIQPGPGLVPAIAASGLMAIVKALEIGIGAALLANRFAALAVIAAWPITLMIAFVTSSHGKPFGIGVALVIIALNAIMSFGYLERYRPMLALHAKARLPALRHVLATIAGIAGAIAITYLSLALRR